MAHDLGPLGISALALLAERPMHPYEMYQLLLARRQDTMLKVKPGTLYHAVARMARDGLVDEAGVEREGNRPERTRYVITDAGRAALTATVDALIGTPTPEYPIFPVAMGEAHTLAPERVVEQLRARRALLERDLAQLREGLALAASRGVGDRLLLAPLYRQHQTEAECAWLTSIIDRISSGDLPWDSPVPPDVPSC